MKVTCNRDALNDALALASTIVLSRTPKPILQCIKLTCINGQLIVESTDLETSISVVVSAVEVEDDGVIAVSSDTLCGIVKESTSQTIQIDGTGSTVLITEDDGEFDIPKHEAIDLIIAAGLQDDNDTCNHFKIDTKDLKFVADQTLFCIAKESTRFAINGVLFDMSGDDLKCVSTDGRRLSIATSKADIIRRQELNDNVIVTSKMLRIVSRLVQEGTIADIKCDDCVVTAQIDNVRVTSSTVNGTFPAYQQVMPKGDCQSITVNTRSLLQAVKRAALLTNEESRAVTFSMSGKDMTLSSRTIDSGKSKISVDISGIDNDLVIGFSPDIIRNALANIEADTTEIDFYGPSSPAVMKSINFTYLMMPINLNNG